MEELKPIKAIDIKENMKVSELVENFKDVGFSANKIYKACEILKKIKTDECKKFFAHELAIRGQRPEDIENLINEIIHRSGLFRCIDGRIEFRHLLLQEFFAGRGISNPTEVVELIKEQWWQRSIIFYCYVERML